MQALAEDELVHDYRDEREFRNHADGDTDYIGNLPLEETWVRFSPTGLNVTGEAHTRVTLTDVVRAVGTGSFIYELLPNDDLSSNPETLSAFRQMNDERLGDLGIDEDDDIMPFGAESLFPKMGFAFTNLLSLLESNTLDEPKNRHITQGLQRYLKIGWAYAGEVHERPKQGPVAQAPAGPGAQSQLSATRASHRVLGEFVAGLEPDGYLGSSMQKWGAAHPQEVEQLHRELREFARDVIPVMREKTGDGPAQDLAGDAAKFSRRRDLEFRKSVLRAQERAVRYAGMGNDHVAYLRRELRGRVGLHFYDLDGADYRRDEALTQAREEELR